VGIDWKAFCYSRCIDIIDLHPFDILRDGHFIV
jgi:hypothetical protein